MKSSGEGIGVKMTIGARVRLIRGPLTQSELAETLGVQRNSVQIWENERSSPSTGVCLRFYEKLGVNINWLLSGEGNSYVDGDQQSIGLEEKVVRMGARVEALEKAVAKITKTLS